MHASLLTSDHDRWMALALEEAAAAYAAGEVPVGCVVVQAGEVIGRSHNQVQQRRQATAHAELLALEAAFTTVQAKYLPEAVLYTTLEPCSMCAGAAFWAQLQGVVFGAADPKRGYSRFSPDLLHPQTLCTGGVMAAPCGELISRFFAELRPVRKAGRR